jgi:hypothetical protein
VVEAWYRKKLIGASEIDFAGDTTYKNHVGLAGIKLATGIDYEGRLESEAAYGAPLCSRSY